MASPAVSGYIAKVILKRMTRDGIEDNNEMYEHPEYSPANIIQTIMESKTRYGGDSIIKDVVTILDVDGKCDKSKKSCGSISH